MVELSRGAGRLPESITGDTAVPSPVSLPQLQLYTDGACSLRGASTGPGGWAALLVHPDGTTAQIYGSEPNTTSNRMELQAAISGLESFVVYGGRVTLYSDSQYLIYTMTRNWRRSANHDLWRKLDDLRRYRFITWRWIRGHNGDRYNTIVDQLAVRAKEEGIRTG